MRHPCVIVIYSLSRPTSNKCITSVKTFPSQSRWIYYPCQLRWYGCDRYVITVKSWRMRQSFHGCDGSIIMVMMNASAMSRLQRMRRPCHGCSQCVGPATVAANVSSWRSQWLPRHGHWLWHLCCGHNDLIPVTVAMDVSPLSSCDCYRNSHEISNHDRWGRLGLHIISTITRAEVRWIRLNVISLSSWVYTMPFLSYLHTIKIILQTHITRNRHLHNR